MEHDGLIAGRWVEKAGQRRRRFYRMTAAGRRRLTAARRNWQDFVSAIDGVVLKPV
jgi:DNA-binding PadR family transcriptional regulator